MISRDPSVANIGVAASKISELESDVLNLQFQVGALTYFQGLKKIDSFSNDSYVGTFIAHDEIFGSDYKSYKILIRNLDIVSIAPGMDIINMNFLTYGVLNTQMNYCYQNTYYDSAFGSISELGGAFNIEAWLADTHTSPIQGENFSTIELDIHNPYESDKPTTWSGTLTNFPLVNGGVGRCFTINGRFTNPGSFTGVQIGSMFGNQIKSYDMTIYGYGN